MKGLRGREAWMDERINTCKECQKDVGRDGWIYGGQNGDKREDESLKIMREKWNKIERKIK